MNPLGLWSTPYKARMKSMVVLWIVSKPSSVIEFQFQKPKKKKTEIETIEEEKKCLPDGRRVWSSWAILHLQFIMSVIRVN